MTLGACVPIPYSIGFLLIFMGWFWAFLLTLTPPQPAEADFHFKSVSLVALPSTSIRRGSAQSAQSQVCAPTESTTRNKSFLPLILAEMSALMPGVL